MNTPLLCGGVLFVAGVGDRDERDVWWEGVKMKEGEVQMQFPFPTHPFRLAHPSRGLANQVPLHLLRQGHWLKSPPSL